jgi:predicted O-methyltransferase YrrM
MRQNFAQELKTLRREIAPIEGFLAKRDVELLAMAAAHPTASGAVLEIGAFRGKSTALLSKAAALTGDPRIVSCDPLTWAQKNNAPAPQIAHAQLTGNLRSAGVLKQIEFHQMTSAELGATWNRPLRLLWVDGDHSYAGTISDLQLFTPHLADGGILLMHDILSAWPGPNRAFIEEVLASPHYGPCGIHGNVAWAQYWRDPALTAQHQTAKQNLSRKLRPLLPYQTSDSGQVVLFGWSKWRFKLLRWRAMCGNVPARSWVGQLSGGNAARRAA